MSPVATATAIEQMVEPWNRACLARDWDALLGMCTEDVVFMPSGAPPVSGKELRPWLEEFPEITRMSWSIAAIEEAGDLAFIRGPVRQTLVQDGETIEFDGKYCDLARRGSDGRWRFAVIMWSPNAE